MRLPLTRHIGQQGAARVVAERGILRDSTLMGHGLPELLCDEGHERVAQLQQSIKGIHQHLQDVQK